MPIYARTYRTFEGSVRRRFRWYIVMRQELSILPHSRIFQGLLLLGYLQVVLRALQFMAVDMLSTSTNNPVTQMLRNMQSFSVDGSTFFDFLRIQSPLVFLMAIYAGAGMICDDFRNNLIEIYFSKPITWRDYVLGKLGALIVLGLLLTAVPGLFLIVLHVALSPTWATFSAMYAVPLWISSFSIVLVFSCSFGVLASSSLFSSRRYASIGVFMILFGDAVAGQDLPELMHRPQYAILAFPLAVNRIGEALFGVRRPVFDLSWESSCLFVVAVWLIALVIICRKARRAEAAA